MERLDLNGEGTLREFRSQMWPYWWILLIMRHRARTLGQMPRGKLLSLLRVYANKKRPYFVGTTTSGVRFLGDYRDMDSLLWSMGDPEGDGVVRLVTAALNIRSGACVDVGANMGVISASVARNVPRRQAFAFEPVPNTARRAAATLALNGLTNVALYRTAIGDSDGQAVLFETPCHSGMATILPRLDGDAMRHGSQDPSPALSVHHAAPMRSLDSLSDEGILGAVSVLKVDVEGFEMSVLRGATGLLARYQPAVIYEYNANARRAGWAASDVDALLQNAGPYKTWALSSSGRLRPVSRFEDEDNAPPDCQVNFICSTDAAALGAALASWTAS